MRKITFLESQPVVESYEANYPNFERVTSKYMPRSGDGDSMLSQLVVAANKIIYKWYNDGDVFDNSNGYELGWANDISGAANWIDSYAPDEISCILKNVFNCKSDSDYQKLVIDPFEEVLEKFFSGTSWMLLETKPKQGNAYSESGPYSWNDNYEEEEEEESCWICGQPLYDCTCEEDD